MKMIFLLLWSVIYFNGDGAPKKSELVPLDTISNLYHACQLENTIPFDVFRTFWLGMRQYQSQKSIVAIADFSVPSNQKRFFVIDLKQKKVLLSTWVAHGKNSGLQMAEHFSNTMESHKSSPGFYRVGKAIQSPKHGQAIQLEGLEKNINNNAQKREIIIHGANYVGQDFVAKNGRCGRSFGCPALPVERMQEVTQWLKNGSLLFIYTKLKPIG